MLRKSFPWLLTIVAGAIITIALRAQVPVEQPAQNVSSTSADAIQQAQLLYKQDDYRAATNLLGQIDKTDPNYGQARAWYALSLYALRDRAQFLVMADTPEIATANLSEPMRNELTLKHYEVLCARKQFATLLPRVTNYIANPPCPENVPLMEEYRLAALYERGMKTVFAAAALPQGDAFNKKYAEGQAQLTEFLKRVVDQGKSDYVLVPNRVLTEEVWVARAALGMDAELDGDLPTVLLLLKDPQIRDSLLPDSVKAEREIKECERLLHQRIFLEVLSKLADFPERHPDSKQLWTAVEYRMAALYERGIKELSDVVFSKDDASAAKRRVDGQNYLTEFLNLAAVLNRTNYASLPTRNLKDDMVQAHTALGNEAPIMQSLSAADKEEAALRNLQLLCKLQPRALEEHLQRMTNFLNDFPNSKYHQRVRYDLGEAVLDEAWRLIYRGGERGKAEPYLEIAHSLLSGVAAVDKEAGVAEADVLEARSGIMRVYYAKGDYVTLAGWTAHIITNSPPGSKKWLSAKLYAAAGMVNQGKHAEAAVELDEILATGFKGNPSYDGPLVSAARWRIHVARHTGDEATAQRVAQLVQSSECYGSLKRTFVKKFGDLLMQQSNPAEK
jgi:hypothetical protein